MFSIVIPLYNKEKQLRQTLETVLGQTFQNFEVVIVDDGSTDSSVAVLDQFADKRIRLIRQPNQGVSAARNRGIQEAQYDYIALLDADDEWYPDYLSSQVDLIQSYPECSVYACGYEMKNYLGETKPLLLNKIPFEGNRGILTNYFEVASCSNPPICSSSVVIKKEAILAVGGFPLGIKSGEDLLTWANLAIKYKIAYSCKSLAIFNYPENVRERESRLEEEEIVFCKLLELYYTSNNNRICGFRKYIGRWNEMRTSIFIDHNKKKRALLPFYRMIKYKGVGLKTLFLFVQLVLPFHFRNLLVTKLKNIYHDR